MEKESRLDRLPKNKKNHQLNLRRLEGWYKGIFWKNGHPNPKGNPKPRRVS